jgi:Protein of unknown function DUF262
MTATRLAPSMAGDAVFGFVEEQNSLGEPTGIEHEQPDPESPAEEAIADPFDPDKIDVITRAPTVDLLLSRVRDSRIDLAPEFQRRAGIWTDVRQSRLIESLLLRIPLPTLYASEVEDEAWVVVDGIQRLTTIARFVQPESLGVTVKPLRLRQLEYLERYNGHTFGDLPGRLQTRIRETELVVHLIRRGTPEEVKYNIFARINTGGVPLSAQELRHALIPGQARKLLGMWAQSEAFRAATGHSVRDERMADREMVLRFLAFHLNDPSRYAAQDFDRFLRGVMRQVNDLPPAAVKSAETRFVAAMEAAGKVFGQHAFRKLYALDSARYPINKALFEAVSANLARLSAREHRLLADRKDLVLEKYIDLMRDYQLDRAISQGTGDIAKVRYRFGAIASLFQEVLDA